MKYKEFGVSFITVLLITSYMSFILIYLTFGFVNDFFMIWIRNWLISVIIGTPSIHFVSPIIKKKLIKKVRKIGT